MQREAARKNAERLRRIYRESTDFKDSKMLILRFELGIAEESDWEVATQFARNECSHRRRSGSFGYDRRTNAFVDNTRGVTNNKHATLPTRREFTNYEWGELATPAVAVPGVTKFE